MRPTVDVVGPSSLVWEWPRSFVDVGLRRLADLGRLSGSEATAVQEMFAARQSDPSALMVTPAVLETIAVRTR